MRAWPIFTISTSGFYPTVSMHTILKLYACMALSMLILNLQLLCTSAGLYPMVSNMIMLIVLVPAWQYFSCSSIIMLISLYLLYCFATFMAFSRLLAGPVLYHAIISLIVLL